jgi:hypothetical protein
MTPRVLPLLLAVALVPGAQAIAATKPAPPRIVTLTYYGFSVGGTPSLTWNGTGPGVGTIAGEGGLGAVQFSLRATDLAIRTVTSDASGQTAGGGLYFLNGAGQPMGKAVEFCGSSPNAKVPVGAVNARVYLDPSICPGAITKGSIRATIAQKPPKRR